MIIKPLLFKKKCCATIFWVAINYEKNTKKTVKTIHKQEI